MRKHRGFNFTSHSGEVGTVFFAPAIVVKSPQELAERRGLETDSAVQAGAQDIKLYI